MAGSAAAQSIGRPLIAALSDHARFWAAFAAVFAISVVFRFHDTTPDVSWLIEVCARILHGERGFIDVIETTPPVPTLLYMPGAWLEKQVGVPAEFAVICYTYLVDFFILWLSWKLLPRRIDGLGASHWFIIFPLGLYLLVLTNDSFSQRETFAAVFMTPMICALVAWRQTGRWPTLGWRAVVVFLAGLAAAIKPPLFCVPLLFCGGYLVVVTRSLRPLYSSGLIAAAVVFAIITAASLWIFPGYLENVYPLMRDVYVPIRYNVIYGLLSVPFLISMICLVVAFMRADGVEKQSNSRQIFLTAAAGFILVFFWQAKYFNYHTIPVGLFCFVAAWGAYCKILMSRGTSPEGVDDRIRMHGRRRSLAVSAIMAVVVAGYIYAFADKQPKMRDHAWAASLDHPTAMAIAAGRITGFPLAREIGAKWVNRTHCQWVVTYPEAFMRRTRVSEEQRLLFKKYKDRELQYVAALVSEKKPEIIIQSTTRTSQQLTKELLERNPTLFDDYKVIAEEGVFRIWRRQSPAGRASTSASEGSPMTR